MLLLQKTSNHKPQKGLPMPTNCETLSLKAKEIFEKLKLLYPDDAFKNSKWKEEGLVHDNVWFDLRRHEDRAKLEAQKKSFIGYAVDLQASAYVKAHKSLDGFEKQTIELSLLDTLRILRILAELDFQIETGDFIE